MVFADVITWAAVVYMAIPCLAITLMVLAALWVMGKDLMRKD